MVVVVGGGSCPGGGPEKEPSVLSALGALVAFFSSFAVAVVAGALGFGATCGIGGGRGAADAAKDACAATAFAAALADIWLEAMGTCEGNGAGDAAVEGAVAVAASGGAVDDVTTGAAAPAAGGIVVGTTRGALEDEAEDGAGVGVTSPGRTMAGALLSLRLAAASLRRMGLEELAWREEDEDGMDLRCSSASAKAASASCWRSCSALI